MITMTSAWRWVQLARFIRTKQSAAKLVLLMLALHANKKGECWPSHETLMRLCEFGSKHTLLNALKYLRDDLKVIEWQKGHSNQFKAIANTYRLQQDRMMQLAKQARDDTRAQKVAECS